MPAAKPFTSALTFGLTDAEALCWEIAKTFQADPRLVAASWGAAAVAVQRRLLTEMRRAARGVNADIVTVRCGSRKLGQIIVSTINHR